MKNLYQNSIQVLFQRATFYYQTNQLDEAKAIYQKLNKIYPEDFSVLANLGVIELQLNNFKMGVAFLEQSLALNKDQPNVINNLANGLYEIAKYNEALVKIKTIEYLNSADVFYNKGRILKALGRFNEAIESYNKALSLDSNHILSLINQGLIYFELKQFNEALKSYQKAIQINPNYAEAYCNLGITYEYLEDLNMSLQLLQKAIEINPNYAEAYYNLGVIYADLKKYDAALKAYKQTIKINPKHAKAYVNSALIKLNLKFFKEGWQGLEKRFLLDEYKIENFNFTNKLCDLNSLKISKKILIVGEQGIGDQILYLSALHNLEKYSNFIDVLLDKRLIDLFQRSFPKVNFFSVEDNIEISAYDLVIPMGCLGKVFRKSEEDFLGLPTSFLISDLEQTNFLKNKLKKDRKKLCGISWKSKNEKIGINKSIDLDIFFPIFQIPNIEFFNLQYGDVNDEISDAEKKYNIKIHSQNDIDIYNNIDGLGSLISSMDFIVTSSNVNAHLAGALGKETYLLVPYSKGKIWYWHEDDIQSIWYPSVNIHRQPNLNNWLKPVDEIAHILANKKIK